MTKLLAVATTLAFLSTPVWAVEGEVVLEFGSSAQDSSTPITVIAKEVTFDRDGRKALFSGDVTVAHDTVKLNADRAEAFSTAADFVENLLCGGSRKRKSGYRRRQGNFKRGRVSC